MLAVSNSISFYQSRRSLDQGKMLLKVNRSMGPTCNKTNVTGEFGTWIYDLCQEDAAWILHSAFTIFTMQTGFGMLESGCVSLKNEGNIMMKNVIDVALGGLTFWIFGFSMIFGTGPGSSSVLGIGNYVVDAEYDLIGQVSAGFMFQLSFATTATTIVSGAMAERCRFRAYCLFSLLNTIIYCVPARWLFDQAGFLYQMGAIDIAGAGCVHILGGTSDLVHSIGFVAAWMLGPRLGRYEKGIEPLPLGNPTNSLVGLFVLWWGWLAFNSGCSYGVAQHKWTFAARAAVNTIIASIGGGVAGCGYSFLKPKSVSLLSDKSERYFEVVDIVNSILGSLVASTAGCAIYHTYDAFVIGFIGGALVLLVSSFADRLGVDDPVGTTAVHGFAGLWGMTAVGIFAEHDKDKLGVTRGNSGIFRGGGMYLVLVQLLACLCIFLWSALVTAIMLWVINKFVAIRLDPEQEKLGLDFIEHRIRRDSVSGQIITTNHHLQKVQENLTTVSIAGSSMNANRCRSALSFRQTMCKLNKWRKIRIKALAASIFSIGLRKKRNMLTSSNTVNAPITFQENGKIFKQKKFPRPIFITEDFFNQNCSEADVGENIGSRIDGKNRTRLRRCKL